VTDLSPLVGAPIRSLHLAETSFDAFDQLKAFPKLEFLNLDRSAISDLKPLAGLGLKSLDLRNTLRLKNVDQLAALPALKAVALPMHIYKVDALRNKTGLVWIGYNYPPKPADLTSNSQAAADFWKMNALEQQLRAADPQSRLHAGKFPYMERRFPSNVKPFGRHWYRYYGIGMTWTEANRFAEELGGHLATVTSPAEDEFIRKNILGISGGHACWIGARTDKPGGAWQWVTGEPWGFDRWGRNLNGPMEPDGARKPSAKPDLFAGYVNHGMYSNSPAWNDMPDDALIVEALVVEWED
jgi:hypothetical protein